MNDPRIGRVVVEEVELQQRIRELGKDIASDYAASPPLLVGILKGAFMFMADLARAIDLPVEFDFMAVSSYGSATRTSGVVRIMKDLDLDLTDRHVLIVEDIVDSGLTLAYLRKNLRRAIRASLEVCALLVKEGLQRTDPDLKYVGFTIPDRFVIGYGLDVDERYRNLPFIASTPATSAEHDGYPMTEINHCAGDDRGGPVDRERIEKAVREILFAIGEDPDRDGLLRTPRAGRRDVRRDLRRPHGGSGRAIWSSRSRPTTTRWCSSATSRCTRICEHHLIPFHGHAHVAYIPGDDGRITGLSKLARLVDGFAKRPQVQERLTTQIADALVAALAPAGRVRDDRGRAPVHVDARRAQAGHAHGHVGRTRPVQGQPGDPGRGHGAARPPGGGPRPAPSVRKGPICRPLIRRTRADQSFASLRR